MSKFLGTPKVHYDDSNGDPLNGGLLYTYEVGTTTNKSTYPTIADAKAATNANANPVVLDSRGEANVVLAGNTKLVLKTSAGSTLWTVDNVHDDADILDANGNEMLTFTTASSATNFININSTATGTGPTITSAGSDTNIGLTIDTKGTGTLTLGSADTTAVRVSAASFTVDAGLTVTSITTPLSVTGTASSASEIRLAEDTDNGTNYMSIKAPTAVTTNTTLTLPNGDGTANQYLKTDGAGTLAWASVAAAATGISVWCHITLSGGTPTLTSPNSNVTSVSDGGVGIYTVNYSITLSDLDQAAIATCNGSSTHNASAFGLSTTSTTVYISNPATGALADFDCSFLTVGVV